MPQLHYILKILTEVMREFKGVFTTIVMTYQYIYIINRRNTLENPTNHLCGIL